MNKRILIGAFAILLASCSVQSAMPLGNDMMQIDVSADPIYGRAGVQQMAIQKAAQATLDAGYDKFIVMNNNGWNENSAHGATYGQFNANATPNYGVANGYSGGSFWTARHPESTMVIKMFHNKDKGADKAVDARTILAQKKDPGIL